MKRQHESDFSIDQSLTEFERQLQDLQPRPAQCQLSPRPLAKLERLTGSRNHRGSRGPQWWLTLAATWTLGAAAGVAGTLLALPSMSAGQAPRHSRVQPVPPTQPPTEEMRPTDSALPTENTLAGNTLTGNGQSEPVAADTGRSRTKRATDAYDSPLWFTENPLWGGSRRTLLSTGVLTPLSFNRDWVYVHTTARRSAIFEPWAEDGSEDPLSGQGNGGEDSTPLGHEGLKWAPDASEVQPPLGQRQLLQRLLEPVGVL